MSANRLLGLDAVRGLAVLGMFAVHVGPDPYPEGWGYLLIASDGRAPAIFTLIAGFSLALARGGTTIKPPPLLRTTLIRCAVLLVLGLWLATMSTGILVILAFYAAYFLACEPFTRLRAPVVAALAAASAVIGPLASYVIGPYLGYRVHGRGGTPKLTDLTSLDGALEALDKLLLSGAYPLLTYLPYLLIGLALGRVADFRKRAVAWKVAGWGTAMAVVGYGAAWLATEQFGGRERLMAAIARFHPGALSSDDPIKSVLHSQYGAIPSTSKSWLLIAEPYSQTPLETLGNAGVGFALIGLAVALVKAPWTVRLLKPLTAVGTMALSVYVVHALALAAGVNNDEHTWEVLFWFCAVALVGTWAWQFVFRNSKLRHGPLEWALRYLTQLISPPPAAPSPPASPASTPSRSGTKAH